MTKIGIFGAGSIGCYVGGRLAASGSEVHFVGRERIAQSLHEHGLSISDYRGATSKVATEALHITTSPESLADADLILVTVKSAATVEAAQTLSGILKPDCSVISFQNGLNNAATLADHLPHQTVITGMVPFNVVNQGAGHFHQGSQGELEVAESATLAPFLSAFSNAGLPLLQHADMPAVLWAKLMLNLNNAINALSGLPLREELSQRSYRRCLAACQSEALSLLKLAGIQTARITPLPTPWLPRLLNVPDFLFRLLANKMLEIDPLARSSMWEDLELGRTTEIDWLNGEVLRLAASLNTRAPLSEKVVHLIREAEQGGKRDWSGDALLAELRSAV